MSFIWYYLVMFDKCLPEKKMQYILLFIVLYHNDLIKTPILGHWHMFHQIITNTQAYRNIIQNCLSG